MLQRARRLTDEICKTSAHYSPHGSEGWKSIGVLLIIHICRAKKYPSFDCLRRWRVAIGNLSLTMRKINLAAGGAARRGGGARPGWVFLWRNAGAAGDA